MKKTDLLLAHLGARHTCLWAALGLLAAVAFGPPPAPAAVSEMWVQRYNGPANGYDKARAVAVDSNGNVVVTGYSYGAPNGGDYYTAKYAAAAGALLWEKRYNGGGQAVAVDGGGNIVVMGGGTIKYLADGTGAWTNNGGGTAFAVDGSGNIVVTGASYNGTNTDYYTAKYAAADGALLWEQRYNGPANYEDGANAVAVDGRGNVVVTGTSVGSIGFFGQDNDYYTAKYAAADGALLWEQRYNSSANMYGYDYATAVAVDGNGNVVVTGYSRNGSGEADHYTAKYAAADGALLWEQHYYSPDLECGYYDAQAVAVDGSGNVAVTVTTTYGDYTAMYAAADGALLWEKRYNGPENGYDNANAVAVDGSGNVVVTASSCNGPPNYDYDYYTAKYAAVDGALLWEKRYNGPANGQDKVAGSHSLALGPNGMVAVTGSSSGDYATIVYRDDVYPISIALVPTGVRLRFTGMPGHSYTIERAPAVTGPWTTIGTQTAPASGLLEHLDTTPPADSAFYRTVQP